MTATNQTPAHHFLLTSVGAWCATTNVRSLTDAIKLMDKDKMSYAIWYVPCAHDAQYEINMYAPQVKGAHMVEFVTYKNGRRSTNTTK